MNYRFVSPYISSGVRESKIKNFAEIMHFCTTRSIEIQGEFVNFMIGKDRLKRKYNEGKLDMFNKLPQMLPQDEIGNQTDSECKKCWDTVNRQLESLINEEPNGYDATQYNLGQRDAVREVVEKLAPEIN